MSEIVWHINRHYKDGVFSHCEIQKCVVEERSKTMLTVRMTNGLVIEVKPCDCHPTKRDAKLAVKRETVKSIAFLQRRIDELQKELNALKSHLKEC